MHCSKQQQQRPPPPSSLLNLHPLDSLNNNFCLLWFGMGSVEMVRVNLHPSGGTALSILATSFGAN